MEIWNEVFSEIIQRKKYATKITYGEETGLILELESDEDKVIIDFGAVFAIRVLDEGIVQSDIYNCADFEELKEEGFANVIYQVTGGEFGRSVKNISGKYLDFMDVKHYIVITQNYNIDILTEWEPEVRLI